MKIIYLKEFNNKIKKHSCVLKNKLDFNSSRRQKKNEIDNFILFTCAIHKS